jgi:hypothetical protein
MDPAGDPMAFHGPDDARTSPGRLLRPVELFEPLYGPDGFFTGVTVSERIGHDRTSRSDIVDTPAD